MPRRNPPEAGVKVLLAKTSLDGHWRGPQLVAKALRDGGFEVVYLGSATAEQIVAAATQEDVHLIGLNMGGRAEIVERVVGALRQAGVDRPILVGGTIPPAAQARLEGLGLVCFPPGSGLEDIVTVARELTFGLGNG